MKYRNHVIILVILAIGTWSCADFSSEGEESAAFERFTQPVVVVPEFRILGTELVPENLVLAQLGFTVSEIRLDPIVRQDDNIAYSTRNLIELDFDVTNGDLIRHGEPVKLPHGGRYVVSIRLEPTTFDENGDRRGSFLAAGFVVEDKSLDEDIDAHSDGHPLPVPFDDAPEEWKPFKYESRRTVFYTFSDVEFEEGEQNLTFNFDIHDWANVTVDPIAKAVRYGSQTDENDVTRHIESRGHGVESFLGNGEVSTQRP